MPSRGFAQKVSNATLNIIKKDAPPARLVIDAPSENQNVNSDFIVSGWTLNQSGIKELDVYIDGKYYTSLRVNVSRPDVAKAYSKYRYAATCGYEGRININSISNGTHSIGVGSIGYDGVELNYSRTVIVNKPGAKLIIDAPSENQNVTSDFIVSGWTLNQSGIKELKKYIDGKYYTSLNVNVSRPDVAKVYPQYRYVATCGYAGKININDLSNGTHSIGVGSIGYDGVELNYHRTVTVNKLVPRMNLDRPAEGQTFTDDFTVWGWAITATGVDWVQISIDGQVMATKLTEETRTDVKNVFPAYINADKSGFSYKQEIKSIKPGAHTIKADVWVDGKVVESQSKNFNISKLVPRMNFEGLNGTEELNDDFQVRGWALNPSGVREVNIFIDGKKIGTTTTGRPRGDVLNVFPAYNDSNSGFLYNVSIDGISDGQHTITVGVIGNDGTATSMSKTVTVNKTTPQELLRRRLIAIINNSKTIGTVSDSTNYDDVVYTFLKWHQDYDRGKYLEATYNEIPNEYKMDFLSHWADLLENGTKVDYTNVLSDNFKNNIPDAPTYDSSLGAITGENKYSSQAALSYFQKYIYPREIVLESSYFTATSTAESKEYLKRTYFQSWARFVYGLSQEEQKSSDAFAYKLGIFLGFTMSPIKVAFDCVEGIQNGGLAKIPGMVLFLAKASVSREYAFALYKLIGDAIDEWKTEYGEADAFNKGRMIGDLICQVLMTAEAGVKTADGIKSLIESGKIKVAFKGAAEAVSKLKYTLKYSIDELAFQIKKVISIGDNPVVVLDGGFKYTINTAEDVPEVFRPQFKEVIKNIWQYSGKTADEIIAAGKQIIPSKGYNTFKELKDTLGLPGDESNWHHIVEQSQINTTRAGFAATDVNNLDNIVSLPSGSGSIHSQISAYYSSIQDFTNGLRVRDWLATKSFDEQFKFGIEYLQRFGNVIPTSKGWVFNPY